MKERITDTDGIIWTKYSLTYHHDVDSHTFSLDLYAVDLADAIERLEYIKQNGKIEELI